MQFSSTFHYTDQINPGDLSSSKIILIFLETVRDHIDIIFITDYYYSYYILLLFTIVNLINLIIISYS